MKIKPFAIERFFAAHEFSARLLLSSSDCEALSVAELLEQADGQVRTMWRELRLGYTESSGHPLLREEISRLYEQIGKDGVLEVVPEEGIFLTMNALLEPGDRVVVTAPAYQSLYEIARSRGCPLSFWEPEEERGWRFDPERLQALMADGPRLVVVNFPHNPTGWLPSLDEFGRIIEIVRKAGAWLFSDEMYRWLEYEPGTTLPSAVDLYERAVALGGLSKTFGAPGLRVGWLAIRDGELRDRLAELKDYTTICGSAPSEVLALAVLRARMEIVERNLALVRRNLRAMDAFISAMPGVFRWTRQRAGSIGLARLEYEQSAERYCERVLQATGILLLPSTRFEYGDHHLRIGLGRANFVQGLNELRNWHASVGTVSDGRT
jgi:aspartate/methionine/tyrosine aminotransferase